MSRGREVSNWGIFWHVSLSMLITLAVVGTAGYFFAKHHLNDIQVDSYGLLQNNDRESLVRASARGEGDQVTRVEVQEVLRSIDSRATVNVAEVVGKGGLVRASTVPGRVGRTNADPDVIAALEEGKSTAEAYENSRTGDMASSTWTP